MPETAYPAAGVCEETGVGISRDEKGVVRSKCEIEVELLVFSKLIFVSHVLMADKARLTSGTVQR